MCWHLKPLGGPNVHDEHSQNQYVLIMQDFEGIGIG